MPGKRVSVFPHSVSTGRDPCVRVYAPLTLPPPRKYLAFPLFSYFSVVVCLICLLHHILSPIVYTFRENREFVFSSIVQFMMSANSRIGFGLQIVFVCLYITPSHYHYRANCIWIHRSYKMPVIYNLSSVWVRLSIFSQLSIMQCVGLCVFSLPISFVLCLNIIKSEVWTITPLFWVWSWNNGMRCMAFYILIVNSTLRNIFQWNVNQNANFSIQANAFESVVCEKTAILSRPQCDTTTYEYCSVYGIFYDKHIWFCGFNIVR